MGAAASLCGAKGEPAAAQATAPASGGGGGCYAGVNTYYLMTRAANPGTRQMVADTLDQLKSMKLTVIRTWAFNDGEQWMSLQPTAGQYSEEVFQGLDWVIVECQKRGLKLMLTLTNYWHEFGGMPQYVSTPLVLCFLMRGSGSHWLDWAFHLMWSRGLPNTEQLKGDDFFRDQQAQQWYRDFVRAVVTRVNSISGVPYREDDTIMAWDICNEPRCEGDASGDLVNSWIDATAAFVKSLDSRHAVTVGLEGFFGPSSPDLAASVNPYNQTHGLDFVRNCSSPNIDFASIHLYPDQWCSSSWSDSQRIDWAVSWVKAHVQACQGPLGGKRLCLQEFGKKPAGKRRAELFSELFKLSREQAAAGGPVAGTLVWMFAADCYPDYDGYTVYASGCPAAGEAWEQSCQPVVKDLRSVELLRELAAAVQQVPGSAAAAAEGEPASS